MQWKRGFSFLEEVQLGPLSNEFYLKALTVLAIIVIQLALSIQTHLFEGGQQLQADVTHLVPLDMF